MNIRAYTANDWSIICTIHDAARRDELSAAGLADAFLPLAETAENEGLHEYELIVAEVAGDVRGFAAFSDDELSWLYVAPDCYGQGIGTSLIQAALQMSGAPLSVEMLDGNDAAMTVYKKRALLKSDVRVAICRAMSDLRFR